MDLILRSIDRRATAISMARKFLLWPLRNHEKPHNWPLPLLLPLPGPTCTSVKAVRKNSILASWDAPIMYLRIGTQHSLNMEIDLQSLFGLHVHSCTPQLPHPLLPHVVSYTRALLVSQDRRHLFVTPLALVHNYMPLMKKITWSM